MPINQSPKNGLMNNIINNQNVVDIIKWFIGSIVIVIVTLIIESGFKERETGIEEMKIYNEYVDIILKADNIEERWKLAEYFAIVTPTQRLRERWVNYQNILAPDYKRYKGLDSVEAEIVSNPNEYMMDSLVIIQEEKKTLGGSLVHKSNFQLAEQYESAGYDALLNKDISEAIKNFKLSEDYYNGYHQVYEIYLYLLKKKKQLANSTLEEWKSVYTDILNKYSWKMPDEYKTKLKAQ